MRRIISLVFTLALILALIPTGAVFADGEALSYDVSEFVEVGGNDGSISTSVTIILINDTFTVNGGALTEGTHYSVSNVPVGLTVVISTVGNTQATVTLTGNATDHNNADDISNLTLEFLDAAFTSGTANLVSGYLKTDFSVNFSDPDLTYSGGSFSEAAANDGSIDTVITATLVGDTYVEEAGEMNGTHFTATNVPAGLTAVVTGTSTTTATIAFTGNATDHNNSDEISDLTITFLDAAFTSSTASEVTGYEKNDLVVDYTSPSLSYDAATFIEVAGNDGSTTSVLTITLVGDTFVDPGTHFTATNVPAGLTAAVTGTSATTATVTLTGNASSHVDADDVSDLTITFLDDAFANSTASGVTNYEKTDISVDFNNPDLTYDVITYSEAAGNDGSIDTVATVTLTGDTFVVPGAEMTLNTHYSLANVPTGLTAVVTGTSATTATVAFTGNAASHIDSDDISNLTIDFLDAAFTNSTAAIVTNASKADLEVDFDDPLELTYSGSAFTEVVANDGSVSDTVTVTLTTDTFDVTSTEMTLGTHYSVANLPTGLTAVVTGTSTTTATIGFSGNATNHASVDDVTDFTVNFLDAAFTNSTAAEVTNASKADYSISFDDPTLEYSSFEFNEAVTNDGAINNSLTLTLEGDTFVGPAMTLDTHYSIANVPAGLTAVITRTSDTTATFELTGNAGVHVASDSVSDLTLTFLDAAFTNGTASTISNYSRSNLEITFVDSYPDIIFYDETHIQYDEADGSAVYVAPALQSTDKSKYLDFSISDMTANEVIELHTEATASTVDGTVTVVGNYIYLGNGTTADVIGGIDLIKNGQSGNALKIIFSNSIPNGAFTVDGLVSNGSSVSNWTTTSGSITLGDDAEYTQGRALTISGTGPYTMALDIANSDPTYYSYETDFDYGSHLGGAHEQAWTHESLELPSGSVTTTTIVEADANAVGGYALKLTSSGSVASQADRYGAHFGPMVVSDTFEAQAGEKLSLDWKASDQGDHYEVYGYLLKMDGAASETVLSQEIIFYGRGGLQAWTQAEGTIPANGYYRFKFVNGTFDKTGGSVVGSYMWIDNIRVLGATYQTKEVVQQVARLVTYKSSEPDPSATRTLVLSVEDEANNVTTQNATIHINNQYNHAPTLTLGTSTPTFGIDTNTPVYLFDNADASTVESGELMTGLKFTVATVVDGADEKLIIDDTVIALNDGNSGTTTNSLAYSVSDTGGTVTITMTHTGLTEASVNALLNTIQYINSNGSTTASNRTIIIIELEDNGGTSNGGDETATLNISSQVTIKATVNDFASTSQSQTTADFSWTVASGATAIKIQQSDDGLTWTDSTHDTLLATATTGQVTGLTTSTTYKFRIVATGGAEAGLSNVVEVTTRAVAVSRPDSDSDSDPDPKPEPDIIIVDVGDDGVKEDDVQASVDAEIKEKAGEKEVVLTIDQKKFNDIIDQIDIETETEEERVVTIEVNTDKIDADKVTTTLEADTLNKLEDKDLTLKIQTDTASYSIPADEINLEEIALGFGEDVDPNDIVIVIEISETKGEDVTIIESSINDGGYELVVPPVTFSIKSKYKGNETEIKKFTNYVEREIAIPKGIDPSKITTAVTYKEDGTLLHIPTYIIERDGVYYAKVNSLTNSIYTLIYNTKTFNDIVGHWSENTVIDMASRLVINGETESEFGVNHYITRGEFISFVTHALGISDIDKLSSFVDVEVETLFATEIYTGYNYSLIKGYGNNDFNGEQIITREEAFVIMKNAVLIADKKMVDEANLDILDIYMDKDQISSWALEGVAFVIEKNIANGYMNRINPKKGLTRAEAAQLVRNMLLEPELIEDK